MKTKKKTLSQSKAPSNKYELNDEIDDHPLAAITGVVNTGENHQLI